MKLKATQKAALAAIFVMMCMLRVWYAIFLFFAFGLYLTFKNKDKTFCASYCPMGAMQDLSAVKGPRKFLKLPKGVKPAVMIVFWGLIAAAVIFEFGNSVGIWLSLFRLVLFIAALSLILQNFYANRTWCTALCPMGTVYTKTIQITGSKLPPKISPETLP